MPRYQSDPARKAVLDEIMAETARAKEAQRDGQWVTYLIRDPRHPNKRGNPGTPIYVDQTNDFPGRVLSRFMKCEKEAAAKGTDCIERRVSDLLHRDIVARYQVLEYQPTHLSFTRPTQSGPTSLRGSSRSHWPRTCATPSGRCERPDRARAGAPHDLPRVVSLPKGNAVLGKLRIPLSFPMLAIVCVTKADISGPK